MVEEAVHLLEKRQACLGVCHFAAGLLVSKTACPRGRWGRRTKHGMTLRTCRSQTPRLPCNRSSPAVGSCFSPRLGLAASSPPLEPRPENACCPKRFVQAPQQAFGCNVAMSGFGIPGLLEQFGASWDRAGSGGEREAFLSN